MNSGEQGLTWPPTYIKRLGNACLLVVVTMSLSLAVLTLFHWTRVLEEGLASLFYVWVMLTWMYIMPFTGWVLAKEWVYRQWGAKRGKPIAWQHAALVDTIISVFASGVYLLANLLFNGQQLRDVPSLLWEANVFFAFVPLVFLVQQFWPTFRRMRGQ